MSLYQIIRRLSILGINKPEIAKLALINQSANWFATKNIKTDDALLLKRPSSGYLLFYLEKYNSYQGQVPERAKKTAELWKNLSEQEKKVYNDKAAANFEAYNNEMAKISEEEKAKMKAARQQVLNERSKRREKNRIRKERESSGQPKKPNPVMNIWFSEHEHLFKEIKGGLPLFRAQAEKWKELPSEEKQKYVEKFKNALNDYNQKMEVWKQKQSESKSS